MKPFKGQYYLPFFDKICKCNSDDAGKSAKTYRYCGRTGTNKEDDGKSD